MFLFAPRNSFEKPLDRSRFVPISKLSFRTVVSVERCRKMLDEKSETKVRRSTNTLIAIAALVHSGILEWSGDASSPRPNTVLARALVSTTYGHKIRIRSITDTTRRPSGWSDPLTRIPAKPTNVRSGTVITRARLQAQVKAPNHNI